MARWPIPPAAGLAALFWALFSAIAYSNAGVDMFDSLLGAAAAGAWMLVWAVRLGLHLWRNRGTRPLLPRGALFYWAFEPAALAVVVALSVDGVFAKARFLASERALTDYAASVRSGEEPAQDDRSPGRRVGLYLVSSTERLDGGAVRFITGNDGLMDAAGFVHSPGAPPPHLGEDSYRPFRGAWYLWRQSW